MFGVSGRGTSHLRASDLDIDMDDDDAARLARSMRQAAARVHAAPTARGAPRRRPHATTEPMGAGSLLQAVHPSVKKQAHGGSATASSLAHPDPPAWHIMLLIAQALLCYHPPKDGYDAWLGRITELVDAAHGGEATSHSPPPPMCAPSGLGTMRLHPLLRAVIRSEATLQRIPRSLLASHPRRTAPVIAARSSAACLRTSARSSGSSAIARTASSMTFAAVGRESRMALTGGIITSEGYQEPCRVACILGGAQAPSFNRHFKKFSHKVNPTLLEAANSKPLK